jgi:hypothetical protein
MYEGDILNQESSENQTKDWQRWLVGLDGKIVLHSGILAPVVRCLWCVITFTDF